MPTDPLHGLVARVVAVRPDAAVPSLVYERFFWTHGDATGAIHDRVAEALILAHWLNLLPDGWMLLHHVGWAITKGPSWCVEWFPTPLEALAAYLIAQGEKR